MYCGVTQEWWSFLADMQADLDKEEKLRRLRQPLTEHLKALGVQSFNRELLKMYIYVCIAELSRKGVNTDDIFKGTRTEIEQMQKELQDEKINFEEYRNGVIRMADKLCPMLKEVMETVSKAADDEEMKKRLAIVRIVRSKNTKSENMARNVEKRLKLLSEMLDNIPNLVGAKAFQDKFVAEFIRLLEEYEFIPFTRDFDKLKKCMEQIISEFPGKSVELCCHKELLELLGKFNEQKNSADANVMKNVVDNAGQRIKVLANENPENEFAFRSCELVELYIKQQAEEGQFKIEILNVDNSFDKSIFYQVENVGIETISDIRLELYLSEHKMSTLQTVTIPEGLHPNQVYAGEYIPNVAGLENGKEVRVFLELSYKKEGIYANKTSYDKILTKKEETGVCGKRIRGYSNLANVHFINREKEINDIMQDIDLQCSVIIYGTNGTGKSSILNHLAAEKLPAYCELKGLIPIILRLTTNEGTDAQTLLDKGLLQALCGENGLLAIEYEKLGKSLSNLGGIENARKLQKEGVINEKGEVDANKIIQILKEISSGLKEKNVKLFVLWDDFEKAIASKRMKASQIEFLKVLYDNGRGCENIQMIFAGSNHMLDVMRNAYNKDADWNTYFARSAAACEIGNMKEEDFKKLLTNDVALGGVVQYSEAAIDYLLKYTNGHVYYTTRLKK